MTNKVLRYAPPLLFCDAPQLRLPAGAALPWHGTQPGAELLRIFEVAPLPTLATDADAVAGPILDSCMSRLAHSLSLAAY
jgi:hypothetical protein